MIRSHFLWISLLCWLLLSVSSFAQSNNIYYVTADGKPVTPANVPGITLQKEWMDTTKVSTLEAALKNAQAGDEIWIKGYEMGAKGDAVVYQAPDGGFKLKSGVSIYGGFAGDEKNKTDRRTDGQLYRLRYRTILTGDENRNDVVDPVNYIFPGGKNYRDNNRRHVIDIDMTPTEQSGNKNTTATVVNGCIVARGHAYDATNPTQQNGGGIYIHGNNTGGGIFRIERCFFTENYGYYGGAIYVAAEVKNVNNGANLIDRCSFFNNAAGERENSSNHGGAVCIVGQGYVFNSTIYNNENGGVLATKTGSAIVNCTITRNTGAGIDGFGDGTHQIPVHNTVVWGNANLTTDATNNMPEFKYSAYPEANKIHTTSDQHNLFLSEKNNEAAGPSFTLPSTRTGYDVDFKIREEAYPQWNWEPMEETTLVDKGSNELYTNIKFTQNPNQDLNGQTRIQGTIDIGAYEFQPLAPGRRRYVKQDGTGKGTSWEDASGDLQAMIDELATNNPNNLLGEVWIAGGTYRPKTFLITGENYTATFCMRDGISVYGGFKGNETSKSQRLTYQFPWETEKDQSTVYLVAKEYNNKPVLADNRWNINSSSRHVVWFAPATYSDAQAPAFTRPTILDRVCIEGGHALGESTDKAAFQSSVGGGIYMNDANAYLRDCVVKYSTAKVAGGGVYLKNGRIIGSLIYNCNAGADTENGKGGGVFVDETGMVLRSMVVNNTAGLGAGVYLNNEDQLLPNYLVVSTSVISNNTARINGGVYCNKGGILTQNTITNNYTPTSPDLANRHSAQTGGVYINEYGMVINSIIWNNKINLTGASNSDEATDIPVYALNPTKEKVRFLYNAISCPNNAVWNNTLQEYTLTLGDNNTTDSNQMGPDFTVETEGDEALLKRVGAQREADWIYYYWQPKQGSNLWAAGQPIGQFPEHVLMAPELDITGKDLFDQKPSIGAFQVIPTFIKADETSETDKYIIYVDGQNTSIEADGSSWDKAHRSLTEAVNWFAQRDNPEKKQMVIRVKAQELWPKFAFSNEDPKTATLRIPVTKSGQPIVIEGSWHPNEQKQQWERNPLAFRSILNSNFNGKTQEEGFYHGVNIDANAKLVLDGFHIINGYAASTASIQSGAGVLAKAGSDVTLRNCIIENNTAHTAAAVDAREAKNLTMINCVVNNNTNTSGDSESVIGVPAGKETTHTFDHLTVVNNIGSIPATITKEHNYNSFAAGNTGSNNTLELATTGEKGGAKNFANPTNKVGATFGFDTYLGGYSEFRPLTSSVDAAQVINQGVEENITKVTDSPLKNDITMVHDRNLGGIPDLGAYEADLPKKGRVYYVRTSDDGGSDTNDGLSWGTAFATISKAVETADKGEVINSKKPQVWVAAGTYQQSPKEQSINCFEILDGVNVYGAFPKTGTPGMGDRHPFISDSIYHDNTYKAEAYETILKPADGKNGRVLGQEDKHNPKNSDNSTITYDYVFVGEGNGDYVKTQSEYIPQEGGAYYYGPGNKDGYWKADGLYADYWYAEKTGSYKYFESGKEVVWSQNTNGGYTDKNGSKVLIEVGSGYGDYSIGSIGPIEYWYQDTDLNKNNYKVFTTPSYYPVNPNIKGSEEFKANSYNNVGKGKGNHIFIEPGKYNLVGEGFGNYKYAEHYLNVGIDKGSYAKVVRRDKAFYYPTTWDGFTIREGKLTEIQTPVGRNGGAGACIFTNVTLKNCIVTECSYIASGHKYMRGGGTYCDEGTLINCYIQKNTLHNESNDGESYGAGVYLYKGTMYNCVINENEGLGVFTDGAGIFIENGKFFNNTVVGNTSNGTTRGNGGISIFRSADKSELTIYNCIVIGNKGYKGNMIGHADIAVSNAGTINCYNTITNNVESKKEGDKAINYNKESKAVSNPELLFENISKKDFRLKAGSPALNMGNDAPVVDSATIYLEYYTDMDFTDRIKDCRVDAGAYESENEENIKAEGEGKADADTLTYYVTQNGAGTRSGENPDNAACAMKLQRVLTRAGEVARQYHEKQVVVKVAGYPGKTFTYHANTLSNPNDPQSYSFVVPYGVTLMGGYCEGLTIDNIKYEANWNKVDRDAAQFMTVLSAIKQGTTTQDVNGYHALTFGEKPVEWPDGKEKTTLVDGVYLEDGAATSLAPLGDSRTCGGGTIVPAWGHLRNCVVRNNKARQGGGLYVLPGGLVTGCGIMQNEATLEGGGIYACKDKQSESMNSSQPDEIRSHLISNTLVENKANTGGGIYLEDGAALSVNVAIWGNTAGTDKNVSGVVNQKFSDRLFTDIQFGDMIKKLKELISEWYPFNYSYIEKFEVPGNVNNSVMSSNRNDYFGQFFTLKPYSILINKGMLESIQDAMVKKIGVAEYDMQGKRRKGQQEDPLRRIDVGAYAYTGGVMPTDTIVKRLFVSPANDVMIKEGTEEKFMGRSFYTSFTLLEDAIDYINAVRKNAQVGKEARETTFEILMAKGTYKPQRQRVNAAMTVYDQRLNSFTIPYNVQIYGGFSGEEKYSSFDQDTNLPVIEGQEITLQKCEPIESLCQKRSRSDHNGNLLLEPWELAAQTVLSGELNISETEKNAYHVVYSEKALPEQDANGKITMEVPDSQMVVLDGITIMKGITHNYLQYNEVEGLAENEVGRGGGVYSKGVDYVLANCRLLENKAVRGGGAFLWDADLYLFNNLFAGNSAEHLEAVNTDSTKYSYGGALVVAATKKEFKNPTIGQDKARVFNLKAINNLWANNSAKGKDGKGGKGGAIAVYNTHKMESHPSTQANEFEIRLANNTFVRNAASAAPVIYGSYTDSYLVNCLLWGNQGDILGENEATANISYSASDVNYHDKFGDKNQEQGKNKDQNRLIDSENHSKKGPHFWQPSTRAGVEGYNGETKWNPIAISPVTDHGSGMIDQRKNPYEETGEPKPSYKSCWEEFIPEALQKYKQVYITKSTTKEDPDSYERYSGPLDADSGKVLTRPIDIGFYEYQYISRFSTMPQIYVAEQRTGRGTGDNWENATDDLRGAIIGAAHPEQNAKEDRTIYVKHGHYVSPSLNQDGTAFPIHTSNLPSGKQLNLTIKGSCTGIGLGSKAVQNFSQPSYIAAHPQMTAQTKQLFDISVNSGKRLTLEGFSMTNAKPEKESGTAVKLTKVAKDGQMALRQVALRGNRVGMEVGKYALQEGGKLLAVNTLFADNQTGLAFDSKNDVSVKNATLVNTTFANNQTADMNTAVPATFNSVAWNNGTNHMPKDDPHAAAEARKYYNQVFTFKEEAAVHNKILLKGPNFVDPLNADESKRDYRIRPSLPLLDKGSNELYLRHAMELKGNSLPTSIPDSVKDLYHTNRQVGKKIDIGAYEYEALLQQIIYVKEGLTEGKADGTSWKDATGDLQGAVDLAGLYAEVNKPQKAYVFADRNVHPKEQLTISLPNAQIYGGMYGEILFDEEGQVKHLLSQRTGMLMQREHSKLTKLQLNADAVVDGFEVEQEAVVNAGTFSTSIVGSANASGSKVSGQKDGLLYNSLVYGNVNGLKAVNVTATGTITPAQSESGNNRSNVTTEAENRYIKTDHWKYQLNETDYESLDKGTVKLEPYINAVGHDRDLIGNKRVRGKVDNGCFETWNVVTDTVVAAENFPAGQSVVYVRSGKELQLDKSYTIDSPFNPGFLLLEHQAGLRGNKQEVFLTNFAVERQLLPLKQAEEQAQAEANATAADTKVYDLAVMPFIVTNAEGIQSQEYPEDAKLYCYDAQKRASFNFKFDDVTTEGIKGAWKTTSYDADRNNNYTRGWLIEGKPNTKVRFYGKDYKEDSSLKQVSLMKANHNEPWNPSISQSNKFTHKENMSWNLFGSPYLCAMKYTDMEYGRVIYGYQDGDYIAAKTYDDSGKQLAHGYIPAGDAVFTQTATLKESENLIIARPDSSNALKEQDVAYAGQAELLVALARNFTTRSDAAETKPDILQLHAVDASEARTDFDMGSDGVKWTSLTAMPQLYAVQNGGHYSLLSAVNREGTVTAGVSLPEAGMYTFSIPEDCDLTNYEVVLLHDAVTGLSTDLTEMPYDFAVTEACETETRFTLSFVRKDSGLTQAIRVRRIASHTFRIEGTQPGDLIRIFSTDGKQVATATASSATETIEAFLPATAIVEVKRQGKCVGVVKVL